MEGPLPIKLKAWISNNAPGAYSSTVQIWFAGCRSGVNLLGSGRLLSMSITVRVPRLGESAAIHIETYFDKL